MCCYHKSSWSLFGPRQDEGLEIDGETMESVTDFVFLGSKITVDSDCSHEIKTCLLLGGKAVTNLDSMLKGRYHFINNSLYSQSYGFPSSHIWI